MILLGENSSDAYCPDADISFMRRVGRCSAYLSDDGKKVKLWAGGIISNDVVILSKGRDSFGREKTYLRFVFDNQVWSGWSFGRGTHIWAKRTKMKELIP